MFSFYYWWKLSMENSNVNLALNVKGCILTQHYFSLFGELNDLFTSTQTFICVWPFLTRFTLENGPGPRQPRLTGSTATRSQRKLWLFQLWDVHLSVFVVQLTDTDFKCCCIMAISSFILNLINPRGKRLVSLLFIRYFLSISNSVTSEA